MFNCKKLFKLQIRPPSVILLITASQDRWIFPSQSWEVKNSIIIIIIIIIMYSGRTCLSWQRDTVALFPSYCFWFYFLSSKHKAKLQNTKHGFDIILIEPTVLPCTLEVIFSVSGRRHLTLTHTVHYRLVQRSCAAITFACGFHGSELVDINSP